jgi:hypothetical protein
MKGVVKEKGAGAAGADPFNIFGGLSPNIFGGASDPFGKGTTFF